MKKAKNDIIEVGESKKEDETMVSWSASFHCHLR